MRDIFRTRLLVVNVTLDGICSTIALTTLSRPPVNWRNIPDCAAVPFAALRFPLFDFTPDCFLSNCASVIASFPARGTSPSLTAPLAPLETPAF